MQYGVHLGRARRETRSQVRALSKRKELWTSGTALHSVMIHTFKALLQEFRGPNSALSCVSQD